MEILEKISNSMQTKISLYNTKGKKYDQKQNFLTLDPIYYLVFKSHFLHGAKRLRKFESTQSSPTKPKFPLPWSSKQSSTRTSFSTQYATSHNHYPSPYTTSPPLKFFSHPITPPRPHAHTLHPLSRSGGSTGLARPWQWHQKISSTEQLHADDYDSPPNWI